jgi:hypothetical protein
MQILQTNAAWLHWRSVMLRQRNANETKSPGNSGGKLRITWHFKETSSLETKGIFLSNMGFLQIYHKPILRLVVA